MKVRSGFTLIELLVVISIIGMLSSVVLAALSSARAKAGVSASLSFDTNIYQSMGDTLVGDWHLDDGTPGTSADGATISDSSISNLSGQVCSAESVPCHLTDPGAIWMNGVNGGSSLYLSGSGAMDGQAVRINVTNNYGSDITVSTWINMPTNNPASWWLVSRGVKYQRWNLRIDAGRIITFSGNTGVIATPNIACASSVLTLGVWHNIVATDLGGTATIYVDGKICAGPTGGIVVDNSGTVNSNFHIGATWGGSGYMNFFKGQMNMVRIYTQAITAKQVQELYASELPAHSFAKK